MKAIFSIINRTGFSSGLNLLVKRNISRFFSSVNLALSALTSSEDETTLPDYSNDYPTSSNRISTEWIQHDTRRNQLTLGYRFQGSSRVPKCGELGNNEVEVMKSILTEMGWNFECLNLGSVDLNEENVIRALDYLFNRSGRASISLCFFKWLTSLGWNHTVRSFCALVNILVSGNMNHNAVRRLICLIRGDPQHLQPNELLEIFREICSRKVLETVHSMLVHGYVMQRKIDEALQAICLMEKFGIYPSARTCNSLIKSLFESDQEELAWDMLEEMQGRSLVSVISIGLFISFYCRQGRIPFAWKFLMDMKSYGIKPDVVAYTIFIHFLCKLSYLKEATCLVFKMIHLGISPDSVLLSSIIHGYCNAGQPGKALCILNLFDVCPNIFVYNSFISNLCKEGDMQKASIVFHEMSEFGILPDNCIYTTMINGYCKANKTGKALEYLGKMLKDGIEPCIITYTTIIDIYCRIGKMEIARHLLTRMKSEGIKPDTVVYNTLINGYKIEGELDKVYEILGMMNSAGILPDIVTYNTWIKGLVTHGFVSTANDILVELIQRGVSPDVATFTNVIGGYSNTGKFEEAFLAWSYMDQQNVKPDVITCSALLNGYCRVRRMDKAGALFNKMLGKGLTPDVILYNTLICGFCRLGNIEEACRLINMMVENSILPNEVTYKALVRGYEKKHADDPIARAEYKVQEILHNHGISLDQSYPL